MTDNTANITLENIQANYNAGDGIYVSTNGSLKAKNIEAQYNTLRTGTIENLQKIGEFLSDDVEYDEWRFTGTNEQELLITLESTGTRHVFDPVLRLYDSSFTLLAEDDDTLDGWNSLILTTLPADGTYYLRVYRAAGSGRGLYDLALNYDDNVANKYDVESRGFAFSTWEGKGKFTLTNGYFDQNGGEGLYIYNRNTVSIATITSMNNGSDGIYINKTGSDWDCPPGGGACTLLGYSGAGTVVISSPKSTGWLTANTTSGNGGAGLYVFSTGNITVSNIDAFENAIGGVNLNNCLGDYYTGICRGIGTVKINVTIPNWVNYIGENSGNGIDISSNGSVNIENTEAKYNGNKGIEVGSTGTITVKNAVVFHNYDTGAFLSTLAAARAKSVIVTDSIFSENEGTGLVIRSSGLITLKGVSADDNISPVSGTLDSVPVTVYDQIFEGDVGETYYFYGRGGQWLDIILRSTEFDAYLELRDNVGDPISTNDNSGGGTDARIIHTLTYTGWFQIHVSYIGTSESGDYLLSVNDFYNEYPSYPGSGAELDNTAGLSNVSISNTRYSPTMTFDENESFGLRVNTNGSAAINYVSGDNNYRSGLSVEAVKNVSVQDKSKAAASTFNDNGYYGIYVHTLGTINLYGLSATGNGLNGADLENCFYSGIC